jgi:hypothetical protein
MAGDRITVGDLAKFSWITSFSHNPVQKIKVWSEAAREIVEKHEHLMKWISLMDEENKKHLAKRFEASF